MTSAPTATHELHSRSGDGIHVQLLWRQHDEHLFVAVTDSKQGQEFCVEVRDRAHALDVFIRSTTPPTMTCRRTRRPRTYGSRRRRLGERRGLDGGV